MSRTTPLYFREDFPFFEYKYHITLSKQGYGEILFKTEKILNLTILVANGSAQPMTGYLKLYPEMNQNSFLDTYSKQTINARQTQVFTCKYVIKYTSLVLTGFPSQGAIVYFQGHFETTMPRH